MKQELKLFKALAAAAMLAIGPTASAETDGAGTSATEDTLSSEANEMDGVALSHGQELVRDKISADFVEFAGSEENAEALVTGLRDGSEVTLTAEDANGDPTESTFTPPTDHLGWGNVFISMALAEQKLESLGITDPTPEQIEAALVGGAIEVENDQGVLETVELEGILQQRADGMGWGQIAKTNGFNLGKVISDIHSAKKGVMVDDGQSRGSNNAARRSTESTGSSMAKSEKAKGPGHDKDKPGHSQREDSQGGHGNVVEHSHGVERAARIDRPEKVERLEKIDRPEKPERVKPERPDKPDRGRKG